MRGEHIIPIDKTTLYKGSSPHARGTPKNGPAKGCKLGIIPACAGNTVRALTRPTAAWDHPRMRGEHSSGIGMIR